MPDNKTTDSPRMAYWRGFFTGMVASACLSATMMAFAQPVTITSTVQGVPTTTDDMPISSNTTWCGMSAADVRGHPITVWWAAEGSQCWAVERLTGHLLNWARYPFGPPRSKNRP